MSRVFRVIEIDASLNPELIRLREKVNGHQPFLWRLADRTTEEVLQFKIIFGDLILYKVLKLYPPVVAARAMRDSSEMGKNATNLCQLSYIIMIDKFEKTMHWNSIHIDLVKES
ncbi:hypothetical protein C2S51_027073 [Perilla frutescens var. frutescens]|nr:hypothetical protein C2S51_027073 [Perilla frutescens var. frutescens]